MTEKGKIELLAPAGNLLKMRTALAFGADAVYAGIPDFSLRTRINDFDMESLALAAKYCRERGKKIYVTANIIAHNRHLEALSSHIADLREIGVDALIVADPGVLALCRQIWPEAELHLSTQANCTNWRAAEFWHKQGIRRVILGRETALAEIREIKERVPELELEYFVHGAMCMAYSGRCFLSAQMAGRSGNLGDCAQPCRWPYSINNSQSRINNHNDQNQENVLIRPLGRKEEFELVEEQHGTYLLNSKDLCLLPYLRQLEEAGVDSFKIEGRAKSVYYLALVCGIYAQALREGESGDAAFWQKELEEKLVHRGYTAGFLLGGKAGQSPLASHQDCEWEFCGQVLAEGPDQGAESPAGPTGLVSNVIKVHNSLKVGDEVEAVSPCYNIERLLVDKLFDCQGQPVQEVHGGQGQRAVIYSRQAWPEYSVLRRRRL